MRLSVKVLIPMLLILAVLALLWAGLYAALRQQESSMVVARQNLVAITVLTNRIGELHESMRGDLLSYYFDGRLSHLDAIGSAEREIRRRLATNGAIVPESDDGRLIDQYEEAAASSAHSRLEFVRGAQTGDESAVRLAFEKLTIYNNRTEAALQDLAAVSVNRLDAAMEAAAQSHAALLRFGLFALTAAILIVAATFAYLQRRVGRRLSLLAAEVERIDPAGESLIDRRLVASGDEIGDLARAFDAMALRLHKAYAAIRGEIGERERTEARLAGVIESATDAIIAINARREIVLVNPAAVAVFGVPAADLLGESIETLLPERFRAAHAGHVEGFGRTGVTKRAMGRLGQIVGRRADGGEFPIEASISQLGEGEEKIYTVILRDITLRAAAENEARQLNADLQRHLAERDDAIRELEAFSYSVAHDLRAPLRAIDGFSRLALEEHGVGIDPELRRYLEMSSASATRMGQLLDDLLRMSRLGRQVLVVRTLDATAQVRECLDSLEPEHAGRQVDIQLATLPAYDADAGLMRQVWLNILGNAFKYTSKTAAARVEVGSFMEDGGSTVYYVRDNGAGFDMRYADKLFAVFQRLHGPSEFPGTGIGLAIVARILQRHGGRIWAEGKPGAGATFYFSLNPDGTSNEPLQAG